MAEVATNTAPTVQQSVTASADALAALVARILGGAGLSNDAALHVARSLVDAELEGISSHGVMLVEMYVERLRRGSVSTRPSAHVISDRGCSVVLDAGHEPGQLTGDQAMALAIEKARRFGAGIVAVRHGFHFGAARRYALAAAESGCIGIVMCNTRPLMPAPGGAERMVGNNPIAIAIPTDGQIPIVLDMATSEAAMGKIRLAKEAGQTIPPTWAVRNDGAPTTDPGEAIDGMLLPAAGAKGFGLAFLIDLMCGLLSGGATGCDVKPLYGDPSIPYDCSHLYLAIDVAHFCELSAFRAAATRAAERVRTSRRAPGVTRIFSPGEPEWDRRQNARGQVKLEPAVATMLLRLAQELHVSAEPLSKGYTSRKDSNHGKT
ncbi:MAG TPA: Ldh family oxidoreductase [Xanthobacteraceae bacterium]|nr:Ldh family oxidoreductase [Xanthobacteraceae bacterium]